MPLISCPDCDRAISDSASICIGCGRPMVPTSLVHAPSAALAAAGRTAPQPGDAATVTVTALGVCGACGSPDVARVSVVHELRTARLDAATDGTTTGIAGGGLAAGRVSAVTRGTRQSELARRLAPPARRDEAHRAMGGGCMVTLVVAGALSLSSLPAAGAVLVLGAVLLLGTRLFENPENTRWNAVEHPRLLAAWARSVVCMRCGAVTDPHPDADARPAAPDASPPAIPERPAS
jgi:hypothetical protein